MGVGEPSFEGEAEGGEPLKLIPSPRCQVPASGFLLPSKTFPGLALGLLGWLPAELRKALSTGPKKYA